MEFWDIASIVFICTAANHLGPIPDIEAFVKRKLPVVGCIKCLTFWLVLVYCLVCCNTIASAIEAAPRLLAISFLSAWSAIWLDLMMGTIDYLYIKVYDTLYTTADETDADTLGTTDTVPDVSEGHCGKTATYGEEGKAIETDI